MTRRIVKQKKAISPILATLLLIVIAVAAIVVTYAWIMTYMGNAGSQAGVRLFTQNVRFYDQDTTKRIDIDIGNSGTSDTKLIQAYIGSSSATLQNQTFAQKSLLAGSWERITVDYEWEYGTTYYFKIVSSSGQYLEWSEEAPSSP